MVRTQISYSLLISRYLYLETNKKTAILWKKSLNIFSFIIYYIKLQIQILILNNSRLQTFS